MGLEYWLEQYRVPLLAICLPISFGYTQYLHSCKTFRIWSAWWHHVVYEWLAKPVLPVNLLRPLAPSTHESRVAQICDVLKERNSLPAGERKKIVSDRRSLDSLQLAIRTKKDKCQVPTSCLDNILSLDRENKTVLVEPMVSVEDAAKFLVPQGYVLASHLEYGRATLGGLAMAVGMTTHAHKTGLLQETVERYELVLYDGTLLTVRRGDPEHAELFACLPWSHGTLGILVGLELKVIEIAKYVKLQYIPFKNDAAGLFARIRDECGALSAEKNKNAKTFVEATLFSTNSGVVTVGEFSDGSESANLTLNRQARWYKPWWFKHCHSLVESAASGKSAHIELIPVGDYILRHSRSIFWVIELMVPYGNQPWFRWLFGWLLPLDVTFMKMTTTESVRKLTYQKQVFQDITLPMTDMEEAVRLSESCFDVWPILIYPCKEFNHMHNQQLRPPKQHQLCPDDPSWGMFFDIGIYGAPGKLLRKEVGTYNPAQAFRKYMDFVQRVGGHPFLYADFWGDEDSFEKLFDLEGWRRCRRRYCGEDGETKVKNFPTLWEKIKPEVDICKEGNVWI